MNTTPTPPVVLYGPPESGLPPALLLLVLMQQPTALRSHVVVVVVDTSQEKSWGDIFLSPAARFASQVEPVLDWGTQARLRSLVITCQISEGKVTITITSDLTLVFTTMLPLPCPGWENTNKNFLKPDTPDHARLDDRDAM